MIIRQVRAKEGQSRPLKYTLTLAYIHTLARVEGRVVSNNGALVQQDTPFLPGFISPLSLSS